MKKLKHETKKINAIIFAIHFHYQFAFHLIKRGDKKKKILQLIKEHNTYLHN